MDIRTLEMKTGLARANIRYYEKEGLLTPIRKENGYRDYSEEDQKNLMRIQLLRRLHFSIEEIRKMQSEDLDLDSILTVKVRELEAEQRSIAAAAEVCRRMQMEKLRYSELEPSRFLMMLDTETARLAASSQATNIRSEAYVQARDIVRMEPHPWKRLFARMLDQTLYSLIITAIFSLVFSMYDGFIMTLVDWGAILLFTLLIEPLLISCSATTLGKWIFGIRIYHEDGRRMNYHEAQERTMSVLWDGMLLNIPILSDIRMFRRYRRYNAGDWPDWDDKVEYVFLEHRRYRYVIGAVYWAVCVAAVVLLTMYAQLPANKGRISMAEYAQNYNEYASDMDRGGYTMDHEGEFHEPQGVVIISMGPTREYDYVEENGVLKEVTLTMECYEDAIVGVYSEQIHAAVALLGAQPGVLWKGGVIDIIKAFDGIFMDDFQFEYSGVEVTGEYDIEGFKYSGDWWFTEEEVEDPHFKMVMTMKVIE